MLTFAHLLLKEMLADFRKTGLVGSNADLTVVGLSVNEVNEEFVELHGWEVSRKYVQVALEREANAKSVLAGEDLRKHVIKKLIAR